MFALLPPSDETLEQERDTAFQQEYEALCWRYGREMAPDWDAVAAAADQARDQIALEERNGGYTRTLDADDVERPMRVVRR